MGQYFLLLGLLLVAMLAACCFFIWDAYRKRVIGELRFVKKTFLTPNELDFYRKLTRALGGEYLLMVQVSMGALIDTALKPTHPKYWEVRQLFSGRICDYVVCDPKTLTPLLVVELDDKMHDFSRDARRDAFLAQAGVATLRFWSRNKPAVPELQEKLFKALGR